MRGPATTQLRICDAEECCKLAVYFASKVTPEVARDIDFQKKSFVGFNTARDEGRPLATSSLGRPLRGLKKPSPLAKRSTCSKSTRDISKSVLSKSRLHKLQAFMEKNFKIEMSIKCESEESSITGDYCSKSDSKEEDRGKGTVVCVA